MKRKNQKIPDSIWMKLQIIAKEKEGWTMTAIINEALDIGLNWWIKKINKDYQKKKEAATKSQEAAPNQSLTQEDIDVLKELANYQKQRIIDIAKTKWTEE